MRILITGANRGIGAALARQYKDAGEEVIGTARGAGALVSLFVPAPSGPAPRTTSRPPFPRCAERERHPGGKGAASRHRHRPTD